MKLSLLVTIVVAAIIAVMCFGFAFTGFNSLADMADATQASDARGFAWFWAFLGSVNVAFAVLAWWGVRTQRGG